MGTFTEAGAQAFRDGQINAHLGRVDAADAHEDRIDDLVTEIGQDTARVSELIADDCGWLCDAAAQALETGDWLGLGEMVKRHALPLIREAAKEDAAAAERQAREDAGEARYEARMDARQCA